MFNIGEYYTRDQIHEDLGGSKQSYLPTREKRVVAACLTKKPNPGAPNVILCGKGPVIASTGASLAKQRDPVPVFIKQNTNRWEYKGKFKVTASYSSGAQFKKLVEPSERDPSTVSLAIELIEDKS